MKANLPSLICVTMPADVGEYAWFGRNIRHVLGVAVSFEDIWLSSSTISIVLLLVVLGELSK